MSFLVQGLGHSWIWFFHQTAQSGIGPKGSVRCSPESGDWRLLSDQRLLEFRGSDFCAQFTLENNSEVSFDNPDIAEPKSEVNVLVVFDQILNG